MTELSKYIPELGEALAAAQHYDEGRNDDHELADALLPVLARVVAEAKAEALREAADEWMGSDDPNAYIAPDRWLRDRADRAEASGREGDR